MSEPGKIDFERLLDWVEGHLSEGESRAVEEQLAAADEATRADAAWLQAFVRLSKDLVLGSPPPEVHDKLVKLFEARAKRRQRPTPPKRLLARLSFDGARQPAFAVRAAGTQGSLRQLVYSTGAADVAVNLRPRVDGSFDLYGQVFPTNIAAPGSFEARLLPDAGEAEPEPSVADDLGQFSFAAVPPGTYDLLLVGGEGIEILISPLQLRP